MKPQDDHLRAADELQRRLQPTADLAAPTEEVVPAGQPKAVHPHYPDRWADGTVRPGFPGPGLVHGGRSRLQLAALAPVADVLEASILSDAGGEDVVSAVKRRLVARFVEEDAIASSYFAFLQRQGEADGVKNGQPSPISAKGRTRRAVDGYHKAVDRCVTLARLIGLERRSKDLASMSLADYLSTETDE